jgi:hypothetical protein
MKLPRKWIQIALVLVVIYVLARWMQSTREGLCAAPAASTAAAVAKGCGETGGTVVNGECTCPNGLV